MVELSGVTVRRGRWPRQRAVISDLTWSAGDAERTVLMGANGAGKSTLLQVLAGLIRPAGGQVRRPETFAYVPQATHVLRGATVVQQVEYMAWLAGRSARDAQRAARGALAAVGLSGLEKRSSRELSGGQARRMALAQALASPGEYLLLDEPTVGLDPVQRAAFHDVLVASGRPFLMTTHLLDAVTDHVDRVTLLDVGSLAYDGTPERFLNPHGRTLTPDEAFAHHAGAAAAAREGFRAEGVTVLGGSAA